MNTFSSVSRLLAVLLLLVTAGCDSSDDRPALGTFTAEVRGNADANPEGTARFFTLERPDFPEEGFFNRATVMLVGTAGQTVTVAFYEPPRTRTYAVESPTTTGAVAYVGAHVDGDNYSSKGGTVTLTRVSDAVIEGTFNADIECCGNSFAGIPGRDARLRGRFSATIE
jgi:hypothetical protein